MEDKIVQAVIEAYKERSKVGIEKYGQTMEREDLSALDWLQHLQEELMDALLYIESAKRCLTDEIEEAMYAKTKTLNENINNIHVHLSLIHI